MGVGDMPYASLKAHIDIISESTLSLRGKSSGMLGPSSKPPFWWILIHPQMENRRDVPINRLVERKILKKDTMDFRSRKKDFPYFLCLLNPPSDPSEAPKLSGLSQGSYPPDTDLPGIVSLTCSPWHVRPVLPRRRNLIEDGKHGQHPGWRTNHQKWVSRGDLMDIW